MRSVFAIFQRELLSLLATPSAWVFLTIYVIVCGLFTFVFSDILAMGQAELSPFFNWITWIFMFVVPALGMSLWTEERRAGTLDMVLSYPASITQFVLGKFLAGLVLLVLAL